MVHKGNSKEVTYFLGKYDDLELNILEDKLKNDKEDLKKYILDNWS